MEHKEAQTAVAALIEAAGFKVTVTGGHETRRDDWVCDEWRFVVERSKQVPAFGGFKWERERYEFPLYTGTGHRQTNAAAARMCARSWGVILRSDGTLSLKQTASAHAVQRCMQEIKRAAKPVAPHVADLAHSWVLDGEAINESFTDWCANFGSDPDSIKALHTYQECCKVGEQLRKMFTREQLQALRDALQDY